MSEKSTYPIFTPNGDVVSVPDTELKNAMAQGGKLAVQMHTPDGVTRFVPHDQVGELQKHGALVNSDQGMPQEPQKKEGFWHSLGSVFGVTPEQLQASGQAQIDHPVQSVVERSGYGFGPAGNMIAGAIRTVPGLAKKTVSENAASGESLLHGDIKGFLAHQIGMAGYSGATVASPVLGDAPAKAGEQLGEGNIKGSLGTTAGIVTPMLIPGAIKSAGKATDAVLSSPLAAKVVRGTGQAVGGVAGGTLGSVAPGPLRYPAMVAGGIAGREAGLGVANAAIDRFGIGKPRSVFAPATEAPLSTTPIEDALKKPVSAVDKERQMFNDAKTKQAEQSDGLTAEQKAAIFGKPPVPEAIKSPSQSHPSGWLSKDGSLVPGDHATTARAVLPGDTSEINPVKEFAEQGNVRVVRGAAKGGNAPSFQVEIRSRPTDAQMTSILRMKEPGKFSYEVNGKYTQSGTMQGLQGEIDKEFPAQSAKPSNLTDSGNPQRSNWRKNQKVLATVDPVRLAKYKNEAK